MPVVRRLTMPTLSLLHAAQPKPAPVRVAGRAAQPRPARIVTMTVRVGTGDAAAARRALQQLPDAASHLCVVVDLDRKRDVACLYVELDASETDAAMVLLMRSLRSAEFGPIRRAARRPARS